MPHLLGVLILLALTALILLAMRRGWRRRERALVITDLPELPAGTTPGSGATAGIYVTTTLAGQPYERVVTRGLGVKSAAEVEVRLDGIAISRQGARSLFLPRGRITGVGTTSGMVGKFAAPDSIVVLTWWAGDTLVDTGIHIRSAPERGDLLRAARELITPAPDEPAANESRNS